MERSCAEEVKRLSLGADEVFHGEGILAVTKALPQSGVSYIGGYQGAPVSHLLDVLGDAREMLDELGIYFENSASEAGAAAMLGAFVAQCRQHAAAAGLGPAGHAPYRGAFAAALARFQWEADPLLAAPARESVTELLQRRSALSQREAEASALVLSGCPDKLIAKRMAVGLPTVPFHLANAFRKLRVEYRTQLAARAHALVNDPLAVSN